MPDQAKTVTLIIDGKSVTVPEGTTVLQACEQAQSPVPFYCYHPGLSIAGNCRICLVEIEKMPRMQIACNTPAAEGMVVHTANDKVLKGRQDVLEFLLVNHPLDCPVCDQAGECWLQDYYMEYGLYDPKFDEAKVKKTKKATPVGPNVMLDMERCILCSRCVRFSDEITKTGEFGIFNRGDHSELGIFPGKEVDHNYSGCVVDICPVGALTDRDFRFKCRVWYLGAAKSVCPGCSMGCNIEVHYNRERPDRPHVAGGDRVMRLKPRYNPDVNQWWMCDEGRYAYKRIDHGRIAQVELRGVDGDRGGTVLAAERSERSESRSWDEEVPRRNGDAAHQPTWDEALDVLAQRFQTLRDAKQLDKIGVILSTYLTNEDLYVAKRLFNALGIRHVAVQAPKPGKGDELLLKPDKSPNTRGAQALGLSLEGALLFERAARKELSVLWLFGHDAAALYGQAAEQAAANLELFVFQGSNANMSSKLAHVVLPSAVYAEKDGTFTNIQGRVQRIFQAFDPMGEAKPDWQILLELGRRLGATLDFADANAVFADLAANEPAFNGLSYEILGDQGALLKGV